MSLTSADTRELIRAVRTVLAPSTFYSDTFFPEVIEFDTETVDFDVIAEGRKLAPYVHADLPARPTRSGGYTTNSFTPPVIKMLSPVKPKRAQRRRAGEAYNGEMSAGQRLEAMTLDELAEQRRAIIRRYEHQAVSAIDAGSITVTGDGYPAQTIDFGRDASLTDALTSSDRWGETDVNPMDSVRAVATNVQKKSGILPTEIVFDPLAAEIFQKDDNVKDRLDNRRGGEGQLELGPVVPVSTGQYLGSIGQFNFWVYQDYFLNDDDSEGQMMPDYTMHVLSPAVEGARTFGAIPDADLGLVAADMVPKVWNEKNPSVRQAMTQSAPLMVPTRINASARRRVR